MALVAQIPLLNALDSSCTGPCSTESSFKGPRSTDSSSKGPRNRVSRVRGRNPVWFAVNRGVGPRPASRSARSVPPAASAWTGVLSSGCPGAWKAIMSCSLDLMRVGWRAGDLAWRLHSIMMEHCSRLTALTPPNQTLSGEWTHSPLLAAGHQRQEMLYPCPYIGFAG